MRPIRNDAGGPTARPRSSQERASPSLWGAPPLLGRGVESGGSPFHDRRKATSIAALRQAVARLESTASSAKAQHLALGVSDIHAHLPGHQLGPGGLACGVLHEVAASSHGDRPAAFGFIAALTAMALSARPGPAVLIASRRALADFGEPYGHGLAQLGLDVGRLLLVETRSDKDALWTLEDTLRSGTRPAMVAGAIAGSLGLTASRRLNLAAAPPATPLVLLRTCIAAGASAAATRWRIAAAPAARDRFGAFSSPRWRVELERCRNGRPGTWLIEWNHVAHCFRLVEVVADRAPAQRTGLRRAG